MLELNINITSKKMFTILCFLLKSVLFWKKKNFSLRSRNLPPSRMKNYNLKISAPSLNSPPSPPLVSGRLPVLWAAWRAVCTSTSPGWMRSLPRGATTCKPCSSCSRWPTTWSNSCWACLTGRRPKWTWHPSLIKRQTSSTTGEEPGNTCVWLVQRTAAWGGGLARRDEVSTLTGSESRPKWQPSKWILSKA